MAYREGYGRGQRWDAERLTVERDRNRFGERDRIDERESSFLRAPSGRDMAREHSVDHVYERRGPKVYEEDRYDDRYYDDGPRFLRREEPSRGTMVISKEREREYYGEPAPPRRLPARPGLHRRQSSLDTFDRKPLTRFVEREEYGPPARYRPPPDIDVAPLTSVPLPRSRGLPPPRRFAERDYEEIAVAEPDYYGDEDFRGYPERVREREIVRRRRRSRSRESKAARSEATRSVRSESISSASSEATAMSVRSEFPKKGKTRMPARLVHKRAIIELGYPFEEEDDVIIIQKALGPENIDEVIKLSEKYKVEKEVEITTTETSYLVGPGAEMSGGRSGGGSVVEEQTRTETIVHQGPPPVHGPPPMQPPPHFHAPPPPPPPPEFHHHPPPQIVNAGPPVEHQVIEETRVVERSVSPARSYRHYHGEGPIILEGKPRNESTFIERRKSFVERSDPMQVGPLALALPHERSRSKDERSIRAEIKALEAEKDALRAERRAEKEMRRADRIRRGARHSDTDLVIYDDRTVDEYDERGNELVVVKRETRFEEPAGGVKIVKDKRGPPPGLVRAMLATLT